MTKQCQCPDGICAVHWNTKMALRKAALKNKPSKPKKEIKKEEPVPEFEIEE